MKVMNYLKQKWEYVRNEIFWKIKLPSDDEVYAASNSLIKQKKCEEAFLLEINTKRKKDKINSRYIIKDAILEDIIQ